MDTKQKLEYQQTVESYLEDSNVYDLFEHLLKELLVDRPSDPLSYLVHKLEVTPARRVFLVGGAGSRKRAVGQELAQRFKLEFVSVGTVLKSEVARQSQKGEEILKCWRAGIYAPDHIIQELVFTKLEELEKREKGYILEGFPRTRVQALALQSAGLIPEKVIEILTPRDSFKAAFTEKYVTLLGDGLTSEEKLSILDSPETVQAAENALLEYDYHSRGVKEVYRIQHHPVEASDDQQVTIDRVSKLMAMRGRSSAPRRPPRVVVLGPPGSGRSTQAINLASRYGLVYISSSQLLKDQVERKTELGRQIAHLMSQGDLVPDQIMTDLLQGRLEETDCKVNGWVADGYPKTVEQATSLKHRGLMPTHVFFLQAPDAMVYERMDGRRLDPVTGLYYGPKNPPSKLEIQERLIQNPEDSHDVIRKRLENYKQNLSKLQAEYRRIANEVKADMDPKLLTELVGDYIENSASTGFD